MYKLTKSTVQGKFILYSNERKLGAIYRGKFNRWSFKPFSMTALSSTDLDAIVQCIKELQEKHG